MEKFIVTPKEDKSVTMTIRIDRALQDITKSETQCCAFAILLVMSVLRLLNKQAQFCKNCFNSHI